MYENFISKMLTRMQGWLTIKTWNSEIQVPCFIFYNDENRHHKKVLEVSFKLSVVTCILYEIKFLLKFQFTKFFTYVFRISLYITALTLFHRNKYLILIFIQPQKNCGGIMLWCFRCRCRRLLSVDTKVSATYLLMRWTDSFDILIHWFLVWDMVWD